MTNERIVPIAIDPLDPKTGLLFPLVAQRVLRFAREQHVEMDPTNVTRQLLARVVLQDPAVRLLAFVNEQGVIRGHTFAAIESDGTDHKWCYVFQAQAEGNVGEHMRAATAGLADDPWLKGHGVQYIVMSTGRREKGWERAWGFKPLRHHMILPITEEARKYLADHEAAKGVAS